MVTTTISPRDGARYDSLREVQNSSALDINEKGFEKIHRPTKNDNDNEKYRNDTVCLGHVGRILRRTSCAADA